MPERLIYYGSQECRGLRNLCTRQWSFTWDGESAWNCSNGSIFCSAGAQAILEVADEQAVRQAVRPLLEANPFASADTLFAELSARLREELDADLDDYVTAGEYYQPVMEDYPADRCEDTLKSAARRLGLSVGSYDDWGESSDFVPN